MAEDWEGIRKARLNLSRQSRHHFADAVLKNNPSIEREVEKALSHVNDLACLTRRRRGGKGEAARGIDPDYFNNRLRDGFQAVGGWTFEAAVKDGVILDHSDFGGKVEGFDIAKFDTAWNLARFWSLCHGRRPLHKGREFWTKEMANRPAWGAVNLPKAKAGEDLEVLPRFPSVLGEIQCGNWALVYRDFFKLAAAAKETQVDLFIYVVADGTFSRMLSDGTVNFERTRDFLAVFGHVVSTPTWVLGVDVAEWGARTGNLPMAIKHLQKSRVTIAHETAEERRQVPAATK